jgi:hypothetical protein
MLLNSRTQFAQTFVVAFLINKSLLIEFSRWFQFNQKIHNHFQRRHENISIYTVNRSITVNHINSRIKLFHWFQFNQRIKSTLSEQKENTNSTVHDRNLAQPMKSGRGLLTHSASDC